LAYEGLSFVKIGCVIKAAGKSRRFGENKLLAELDGRELLSYVLDALPRERFSEIVAVVSDERVGELCRRHGIEALTYEGGPVSETIRLGMSVMGEMDGCMFVSGDQPLCRRISYERLLDAFAKEPDNIARLSLGGVGSSPAVFPRRLFGGLTSLSGEQGGKALMYGEDVKLVPADFAAEFWDADTETELAELEFFLDKNPDFMT